MWNIQVAVSQLQDVRKLPKFLGKKISLKNFFKKISLKKNFLKNSKKKNCREKMFKPKESEFDGLLRNICPVICRGGLVQTKLERNERAMESLERGIVLVRISSRCACSSMVL